MTQGVEGLFVVVLYSIDNAVLDMGLTRGTEVYIRKVAPLGDPVEVTVRNYELSIRKADAEMIEIEAE